MHDDLDRVLPDILRLGRGPALLGELANMTIDQLAETYRELYGEPTRSRNKGYLRKRLAWRIQELTQGGLSLKALEPIRHFGDELPERWRMRAGLPTPSSEPPVVVSVPQALVPRDPRIPSVGSVLRRAAAGSSTRVRVRRGALQDPVRGSTPNHRHPMEWILVLCVDPALLEPRGGRRMNDFYRTQMEHRFFESTLPGLVRELARLNDNIERLSRTLEQGPRAPEPPQPPEGEEPR